QDFEMNRELKLSVIGLLEEVLRDPDLLPQERKATANILRMLRWLVPSRLGPVWMWKVLLLFVALAFAGQLLGVIFNRRYLQLLNVIFIYRPGNQSCLTITRQKDKSLAVCCSRNVFQLLNFVMLKSGVKTSHCASLLGWVCGEKFPHSILLFTM
ncbi:unnamed protein product, partial [Tetraodon nigroviridis]